MAKDSKHLLDSFTYSTVISQDGTAIGYRSIGCGPGLLVIPGALSASDDFTIFASYLSDCFTIHLIDRRGRGASGPQGSQYSIGKESEDVKAVLEATGASYVFGHSYGGLVALEAARANPSLTKLALYEPGVFVQSRPADWAWMSEYEEDMKREDYRGAFTSFVRGAAHSPLTRLPKWYAKFILRMAIRGDHWHKIVKLLPANLNEHREVRRLAATYSNYQAIQASVYLMSGQKSPESVHQMIRVLDQTIPQTQTVDIPKLHHLSPNNDNSPEQVAQSVKPFLLN